VRAPPNQETHGPMPRSGASGGLSPMAALVRRHDRDRFQTVLFAPPAHREALFALYAFNYEIARIRDSVSEAMLGHIRLQWWREAIDTAYAGGAPRDHDVVQAVTAAIRDQSLDRAAFDRLIDTRERDLDEAPPATLAALEDYAEGTAATLLYLALEVLGATDPASRDAARHIGIAYGLAGLSRAMPFYAATGRPPLPADLPLQTVAGAAARHLAAARALRREVPAAALPALLPARIADGALRCLERAGYDPFKMPPGDPLQSWRLAYAALTKRF
jgi:NADH dehydrogenase [ubiquinone] 1 alpha subcomplex assembly factor 6